MKVAKNWKLLIAAAAATLAFAPKVLAVDDDGHQHGKYDPAPDLRYMAMGGSVVAGRGAIPQTKGWVYVLYQSGAINDIQNLSLTNAGAGGGVTSLEVLNYQVPLAVQAVRPDVITIMVGANDLGKALDEPDPIAALPGILARFRVNLRDIMLNLCAGLPDARVYIANLYDLPVTERAFPGASMAIELLNVQIRIVANQFGVPVVDLHTAFEGGVNLWEAELHGAPLSAHPTEKGHRIIANTFAEVIATRDGHMTCPVL